MINATIARITARGLFGRRRFLLLLPLPLLLVGLAVLARALGAPPAAVAKFVIVNLGFAAVLPVISLIVGTGVLGSEIDDGTLVHVLAKPLPRREIIVSKLAVAVVATAVTVGVPMFVGGLVAGSARLGIGLAVGCVVGAFAYSGLFLALSLLTRRPVLLGLLYVLLWEGLLGKLLGGTRVLSIQQYVTALAARVGDTDLFAGQVSVSVSVVMAIVFTVGGTLLAIDRLRSFSVAGETS
ncbi:ABC transporter permease [Planosporangium thailandense]|uniref:ABC transporter permease n=1 Tax=Planosporangium thailandense TaxID=765197 RepID=A0ABX0XR02_9ACTN|nr:ABC transporter permease subunit [Planosporangium thailandense]NJC68414.1 ABC transporter permease [Planosporangium thailandense]